MQIADGVYSLGQKQGGHVHAYLFENAGGLTLVDTLFDKDARRILELIRQIGRRPQDLKHIVLTHAHRSHLGGVAKLRELSGALVYAHEWEADIVARDRPQQPVTLVPHGSLKTYHLRIGLAFGLLPHPPCPVDRPLAEGDAVGPLQVIHIPGHTPGHMAFHDERRGVLAVGDAVASWPSVDAGWPAFNLNERLYRLSFQRLPEFDAKVIAVGHGEPITTGAADVVHELAERLRG